MLKKNTFIYPIIRSDLIERSLETLYQHTPHNFYVYVIDQSVDGLPKEIIDKYIHLYVRPRRNLGFAKATNTGIRLVQTKYFTMVNDDVEFINERWWQGVIDTFDKVKQATPDRPAVLVNPASVKLADWSVGRDKGDDFYIMEYKRDYTNSDYDNLIKNPHYINEHLTLMPGSVIDGIVMYCSVCETDKFMEAGLLDERYYPGSAEDYDWNCRASMRGYRSVGTTLSWVFHHWSSSFKSLQEEAEIRALVDDNLRFGDHHAIWGDRFDIWGIKCNKCDERLRTTDNKLAVCPKHSDETFKIPQISTMPL